MRVIALIVRAGAVVVAAGFLFSLVIDGADTPVSAARTATVAAAPTPPPKPAAAPAKPQVPPGVVTIAATGDIVMGSTPEPPAGRWAVVLLRRARPTWPATSSSGTSRARFRTGGGSKCGAGSANCFAFQTPPSYARGSRQAGFTSMNLANNHAYDFGERGLAADDRGAATSVGLEHTGRPGPGDGAARSGDPRRASSASRRTRGRRRSPTSPRVARSSARPTRSADVVVVTIHAGAEGRDRQHVPTGTETLPRREPRQRRRAFAHAVDRRGRRPRRRPRALTSCAAWSGTRAA